MTDRPAVYDSSYADQYRDPGIVAAYHLRPPYPSALFEFLASLITDTPRRALDVGCGQGEIARFLAPLIDQMDAVDQSAPMIATGKQLPGGDDPRIRWIVGRLEEVALSSPYALITAAASLHWMDWDVVMPRLRTALSPNGHLALISPVEVPAPWTGEMMRLRDRFTTDAVTVGAPLLGINGLGNAPLITELTRRGRFAQHGAYHTDPMRFTQSVDDYVASWHARRGCSRERMGAERAAAFDAAVRELVMPYHNDGNVHLQIVGEVVWGVPQ